MVLLGSSDKLTKSMSCHPPSPIYNLKGDMAAVNCLDFLSPDLLCAGTTEGNVHIWNLSTKREKHQFKAGSESCLSVYSVGGELVTQEKGGIIHMWSPEGGSFSRKGIISCSSVGFCKLDLTPSSAEQEIFLFCPSDDSSISIISLRSQMIISSLKTINEKLGEVMVIKYFEMGGSPYLLSAYESGHIYLWDLRSRKFLSELKIEGTPMDMDFDSTRRMGVCGMESNELSVFKIDSVTNKLSIYKTVEITNPGVSRIRIRPDRKILAVGGWDGRLRLYSWKTLKPLAVLTEHQQTIHDIYFINERISCMSNLGVMAVAGKDQRISLWDVYTS